MSRIPTIEGFVFTRRLSQSAYCGLWRAVQTTLDRDVLVVVLTDATLADTARCGLFYGVARRLAQSEPQLVPEIIDVIRTEHHGYIILEDAHARPVLDVLAGHRMTAESALALMTRLAEGLAEFRSVHLVYGGLKPKNIYLTEDGEPLLPDPAAIRYDAGHGDNPAGPPMGSPAFVAPEQYLTPETVDFRADMFALAMTLYALGTGQVPFGALPADEILSAKLERTVPSPCDLVTNFPKPFAAILAKLAQRRPENRYADWDDVLFDLHQAKEGILPQGRIYEDSVIAEPRLDLHPEHTIRLKLRKPNRLPPPHPRKAAYIIPVLVALLLISVALSLFWGILWLFRKELGL